ncbi:MAG TPA: hypothetical protein VKX17_17925 [Planctomycetota bacterium]|nr:hypothetical protein [Planctomycetota bacterium]
MPFEPRFTITPEFATSLMRIEAARQAIRDLLILIARDCWWIFHEPVGIGIRYKPAPSSNAKVADRS